MANSKNQQKNQLQQFEPRTMTNAVMKKIKAFEENGELQLPQDYSAVNALNAAFLAITEAQDKNGRPASVVCTGESAATALLHMVVQGLDPSKNQCYFVVYGKQLTLMRSYMGTVAAAKRFSGIKEVTAQIVYQGDDFEYEINPLTGNIYVTKHRQSLANRDSGVILAAYATVTKSDDITYCEVMTWKEIQAAWRQGATNGNSPAHQKFPDQMAKKTVINRACKLFVNTASDASLLAEAYNATTANDYKSDEDVRIVDVQEEEMTAEAFDVFAHYGEVPEVKDTPKEEVPQAPKTEPQDEEIPQTAEDTQTDFNELTDEEKAEIEAQEKAAAEAEAEQEAK